jgi:hypothetical protein
LTPLQASRYDDFGSMKGAAAPTFSVSVLAQNLSTFPKVTADTLRGGD